MPRPFESHIPRFPETAYQDGGKLISVPVEDSADLPTANTSIFAQPGMIEVAYLIQNFTKPGSNQRHALRDIRLFGRNPENLRLFSDNTTFRSDESATILIDLDKNYPKPVTKLAESDPISSPSIIAPDPKTKPRLTNEEVLELRQTRVTLPEVLPIKMPGEVLKIVNSGYDRSFPWALNKTLPPLTQKDIAICTMAGIRTFLRHKGIVDTHTLRLQLGEEMRSKHPTFIRDPNYEVVITNHDLPGKPVFYPEEEFSGMRRPDVAGSLPPIVIQALELSTRVKVLAHEGLHRASKGTKDLTKAIPVTADDPLFKMAFTSDRYSQSQIKGLFNRGLRKNAEGMTDRLFDYAKNNNPVVMIEGARIALFCDDDSERKTLIAESGYDLTETLVELLTMQSLRGFFYDYLRQSFPRAIADPCIKITEQLSEQLAGSSRQRNLLGEALDYLKRLGLEGPGEIMDAYVEGNIPLLHAEKFKPEEYYT